MSRRLSIFAYATLLLVVISLASSFARPTVGQVQVAAPPAVGRFQMAVTGTPSSQTVYVIDTATGKLWSGYNYNHGEMKWCEEKDAPFAK